MIWLEWFCDTQYFYDYLDSLVSELAIVCTKATVRHQGQWRIASIKCKDEADATRLWFALWNTYRINATTVTIPDIEKTFSDRWTQGGNVDSILAKDN